MTPAERKLWYEFLRDVTPRVRRQRPFGPYILDFYCAELQLVIEADGGQHFTPNGLEYDQERDAYLVGHGLRVLCFANPEIMNAFPSVTTRLLELGFKASAL
jgi:very-short-patch-repair endonuclease